MNYYPDSNYDFRSLSKIDGYSFLPYVKGNNAKDIEFLAHEVLWQQRKRDAMRLGQHLRYLMVFDAL
jgi:hypothetical protein